MTRNHRRPPMAGFVVLLVSAFHLLFVAQVTGQVATCANYSSTSAAQFALDINPGLASTLDPDGNGIACDDGASGQSGTSGADRSASDLQLPGTDAPSPTPAGQQGQTPVDAIDQQPTTTGTQTLPTQPPLDTTIGQQGLDGRIGSSRAGWETIHGAPINEEPGSRPEIMLATYAPLPTSSSIITLWFNDQAFIILVSAETSWSGADAAGILDGVLPSDITSIPDGEVQSDGSLMIPMVSQELVSVVTAESMAAAGAPGVPGDFYLLLVTDESGDRAIEIEIGIGNGDNVREDINDASTTTTIGQPAPTPAPTTATTTTDATSFLQETRVEIDLLLSQYDEFMAILASGTFTNAEIDRMSAILADWIALDTTLSVASPEHAAIATQLQQVRTDLSAGALLVLTALTTEGDTTSIDEALGLLDSAHASLLTLDQRLATLGV